MTAAELKTHRTERLKWTQRQLAEFLSVHLSTVKNWESGRTGMPRSAEMAIRDAKGAGNGTTTQGGTHE